MSTGSNYRVSKPALRTPTCDICKARHQKCSGAQPQCNNCELRGLHCTYSQSSLRRLPSGAANKALGLPTPQAETAPQHRISDAEYDRIYSQIFGDIVRRFDLDGNVDYDASGDTSASASQRSSATLPSLYREVATMVREYARCNTRQSPLDTTVDDSSAVQSKEPALERDLEHSRKLLKDSLPSEGISYRLVDLFFDFQNSIFYVCNREKVRAQLSLMYTNPDSVSISWFCQMFLIFAVGVQFDDLDDTDGATYYEIGLRHIDDAVEEDPQNSLWVIRAMLLLCFYPPPTKWSSIWLHFDAAIRGAHKFQLDLGHNALKDLPNEEYQEWRQLWLTMISFDRWVAIFLGRLPRITESISRDPVFKHLRYESNLDCCMIQNSINSLAIVSGFILRSMYFSQKFSLTLCQQRKTELETWLANLTNPLRQQVESGLFPSIPKDQAEAVFQLHFMYLGTWILLTKPSLMKAIKMATSATRLGGSILSAVASDAGACVESATRLIKSATTLLGISMAPKRSFLPVQFLITAAHVVILGVLWKVRQSGNAPSTQKHCDYSVELTALDESISILNICGQRNVYSRKYSSLLKDLRQDLDKALLSELGSNANLSSRATRNTSLASTAYNSSVSDIATPAFSDLTNDSPNYRNTTFSSDLYDRPIISMPGIDKFDLSVNTSNASIGIWTDQSSMFYLPTDVTGTEQISPLRAFHDLDIFDNIQQ